MLCGQFLNLLRRRKLTSGRSRLDGKISPQLELQRLEDRTLLSISLTGVPTWTDLGPRPLFGPSGAQVDQPIGAIQAIAVDPTNAANVYVGSVNGGVWHSSNATGRDAQGRPAPHWTALTDQYLSLSIGALSFSPLDPNHQTLFAGIGTFTNAAFKGGPRTGLLETFDGGATWISLGQKALGGLNVKSVVPTSILTATGEIILVATTTPDQNRPGGLFRSEDGGLTFQEISGDPASNLPEGDVSDLIGDPNNPLRFYAAVTGTVSNDNVYRSEDGGQTWIATEGGIAPLPTGAGNMKLAIHSTVFDNVIYVGVTDQGVGSNSKLSGVFRSTDLGEHWTALGTPPVNINPVRQGRTNFALAADPIDPFAFYLAGDAGPLYLGDASTSPTSWNQLVGSDGSLPHSDSRQMVFDPFGSLLESNDGGIYRLERPAYPGARPWESLNGDLEISEFYSVAYDASNNVVIAGAQDNGVVQQRAGSGQTWYQAYGGDGFAQAVDNSDPNYVRRYSLVNTFDRFYRNIYDAGDSLIDTSNVQLASPATPGDRLSGLNNADRNPSSGAFLAPFALNATDPSRMLLGHYGLYESRTQDAQNNPVPAGDIIDEITFRIPGLSGTVLALAYGGFLNGTPVPSIAYVGTNSGKLYLRAIAGGFFSDISPPMSAGVSPILGIALDPTDWRKAYMVTTDDVFMTPDAGDHWQTITGNLQSNSLNSIALFEDAIVGPIVLVGGQGGLYRTFMHTGSHGTIWTKVGANLPNAPVTDIHYLASQDTLLVGTLGRGAWEIPNASLTLGTVGILHINGDLNFPAAGDTIRLVLDANNPLFVDAFVNDALAFSVRLAALEKIDVSGLGGNNTLIVDNTNAPIAVPELFFDGGPGNNTLEVLSANDPNSENVTFDFGQLTGLGPDQILYRDISNLNVVGGTARNIFTVNGLEQQVAATISTGDGDNDRVDIEANLGPITINLGQARDIVNISPTFQNLGFILGAITVHGGGGVAALNVFDQNGGFGETWFVTSSSIIRQGSGSVYYDLIDFLTIDGASGGNAFYVQSTATGTATTINSAGTDSVTIGNATDGVGDIQGPVSLVNQPAAGDYTALVVDDSTYNRGYWQSTLTNSSLTTNARSDNGNQVTVAPINFRQTDLRSLTILLGNSPGAPSGNVVTVANTPQSGYAGGPMTTITSGTGVGVNDAIFVEATTGPLTVNLNNDGLHPASSVILGAGVSTLDNIRGAVTLNTLSGWTDLELDDSANSNDHSYTMTGSTIAFRPNLPVVTYHLTNEVFLLAGSGINTVNVNSTSVATLVNAGLSGKDVVNIGDSFKTLNGISPSYVIIQIDNPGNRLVLYDRGDPATRNYNFTEPAINLSAILRTDTASNQLEQIYYSGPLQNLTLNGSGGSDTFQFQALPPGPTQVVINGASGSNTVRGPDTNNSWQITGANAGNLDSVVRFASVSNLQGGSQSDVFQFQTGGSLAGQIDGGAGSNTLDYSAYVGNVIVDLPLQLASLVHNLAAGNVLNIENVIGSQGNDLLVGDANPNVLTGGSGRNVIIGGAGADTITGGGGDNILIGGTTAYDQNLMALEAVMQEWTLTSLSFSQRLAAIMTGVGPSRQYALNQATVLNDGVADVLTGGGGFNWFFFHPADDTITNQKSGDVVTLI